ncbi:mechanosensitive ion channel domain-containing protein [Celeribacter baekdonensis]|uniref:Small-conductance mechanosensitive channel n=1 Tax=Celeribacter baekdonensis TaxID=875171 RepID=A0A2R4M5B4_9RHOB|nr:mechanosensitive ion channel domain-containing protein [Celeribacter baekdonensis]AVW92318.1 mechanosensitive ion channel protein MscS [Celeribacter baekdonensis]|tara:strand:- start:72480 stop:73328 length:849 start_codon:yes stop_codon:yes gene_type:complete
MIEQILNYPIYNGQTVGDYLSLEFLLGVGGSILGAVCLVVLGMLIAGWVARRIRGIGSKYEKLDNTLFNFLGNIARYVILAFTALIVLNTFGIQTTSIVAVIGAAGLAIGLALQGTLSNVAAGVMIILFRPFKIGDFVDVAGKMGTVKDISLNFTELADLSNVQVIVPNSQVWGNIITNFSTNQTRRAEWTFGVGYGANLKTAEEVIRTVIMSDPRSLSEPEPFIQVNNLGDFSVDFLVRVWVKSSDFFQYQADMKRQVKEALDEAGVDIPFPTRTLLNAAE